jgi:hypothetical protein
MVDAVSSDLPSTVLPKTKNLEDRILKWVVIKAGLVKSSPALITMLSTINYQLTIPLPPVANRSASV